MSLKSPPLSSDPPRAIVIGAGIAGLAAALRLAVAGLRVTLLDRHDHPGGKIRTTPSAAGPVDAGPTVLTLRHIFDDLFACAGARLDDHLTLIPQDILARHVWPDGATLDLHADPQASAEAISQFAGPGSADDFRRLTARTARLFEAFDTPMMQAAEPRLSDLAAHVILQPGLIPAMAPLSSLSRMLRRQFRDPRLAQLFGRYATYVGGSPHLSPALLSLIWQAEAAGVWVVEGGMHRLVTAIADLAEKQGVDIRLDAHVEDIGLEAGRARSVTLSDGRIMRAEALLYAGDPRALASGSMGKALTCVAPQTLALPRSHSARVHSFAARAKGRDLAHHNVFFAADPLSEFRDLEAGRIPTDPTLYLCAEDRGQSQPHTPLERFEIISNAPATETSQDPEDLIQWHHQTMQRLANFNVSFTPKPTSATITTPQHFAAMFPESLGALYGQTPHGMTAALRRPTSRTPIPGLWLAGGGTHPGAGLPMATLSARHAAEAILNDQTSASPSRRTAMRGGMSTA